VRGLIVPAVLPHYRHTILMIIHQRGDAVIGHFAITGMYGWNIGYVNTKESIILVSENNFFAPISKNISL
jgi:hypothetical protein